MTWLDGRPHRARRILWPTDDPELDQARPWKGTVRRQDKTEVLDDRIVHCITLHLCDEPDKSLIYLADLRSDGDGDVVYRRVATLSFKAHCLTFLAHRHGFATLEFDRDVSTITLRVHSEDGSVLFQRSESVIAAYGWLVSYESTLAICIRSGNPVPETYYLAGHPERNRRVDFKDRRYSEFPIDLVGDQILVWDTAQDQVVRVDIPQDPHAPMQHDASFVFLDSKTIALAGFVSASFGMNSALLKVFSTDGSRPTKTFSEGNYPGEFLFITNSVASKGSSDPSDIVVHCHDGSTRLSVIHSHLLMGRVPSEPTTDDPPGLIDVFTHHSSHIRTCAVYTPSYPAYVGNRLLAAADPLLSEYNSDDEDAGDPPPPLYVLDFAQPTLHGLLQLDAARRETLQVHLPASAQVKVVSRKFLAAPSNWDEREIDAEYPYPAVCPPEWTAHLAELYARDEARREGRVEGEVEPIPPLEYDEGPAEHRDAVEFGYVQTRLRLGVDVDHARLALTRCGVVEVPAPMKDGWVFYFDEADMNAVVA